MLEPEITKKIECPYYRKCNITWKVSSIYKEGSEFYKALCGSNELFNCAEFQRKEREKEKENSLEKRI